MAGEQEETNGAIDNGGKCEELEKGTENQTVKEIVVLDSDGSESRVDGGEHGAAKTGGVGINGSCSSCKSRPIPPFLQKIYDMLGNDEINSVVSWSCTGTSFVIKNPHLFAANVLPIYFRHNNFPNFITQLNSYGFKKISWEQCEYRNEFFRKGERHLLRNIKRRNKISRRIEASSDIKPPSVDTSPCSSNMDKELAILMKEHHLVQAEIMKLKENQQTLEEKFASLQNQAISNKEDQKRTMLVAQRILKRQRDPSSIGVPMPEESRERGQKNLMGKRKLEVKSATTQYNKLTMCSDLDSCSNISMLSILELMSKQEKMQMLLNEEEMAKHQPSTFISLEDLIGESSDWVQYLRELLQEKANHLKS